MLTKRFRRRVERDERGAALVEFALVFPLFMTLVLGMFSGGIAYDRKLTLTNAAREGSRYGATLAPATLPVPPPSTCCGIDQWVYKVADAVMQNADGNLDAGVNGRYICVAYVYPGATTHAESTHKLVRTTSDVASDGSGCFPDGLSNADRRVQIEVRRKSPLETLVFSYDLTLTAKSVTRFEATDF